MSAAVEARGKVFRFDAGSVIKGIKDRLLRTPKSFEQLVVECAGVALEYKGAPQTIALGLNEKYRHLEKCLSRGLKDAKNKAQELGINWDGKVVFPVGVSGKDARQSILVNGSHVILGHVQDFDRGLYKEKLEIGVEADWEGGHSKIHQVALMRTNHGEHGEQVILMERIILSFEEWGLPNSICVFRLGEDGNNIEVNENFSQSH